ncbi:MAG: YciI family protein [Caulobacteraceae bacterium]|nr:YciI family protein [Caulobacteraceae bacterium]
MRFMVLVKASEDSEAGVMPSTEMLAEMGRFNEELVKAGAMLDGDGLKPSRFGARILYDSAGAPTVTDGPFAETKELVAGYWIIDVKDRDEAIAWMRRAPFRNASIEIRPYLAVEDFGEALTPELLAAENELRAQAAAKAPR